MESKIVIAAILILIGENMVNVFIDAYKIKVLNKAIRHGINFSAYALVTGLCIWLLKLPLVFSIIYCLNAFFNRQVFFDVTLNLRRGLSWNYVSLDRPPKAIMDRIEVRIFGYNGTAPTIVYFILFVLTTVFLFVV